MNDLRELDGTSGGEDISQSATAEAPGPDTVASQYRARTDAPPKAATATRSAVLTELMRSATRVLKPYRVEVVTAVIALTVTLCSMTWSSDGRLEDLIRVWTGLDVAVRHRDTGAVLVTGASRREAVERHLAYLPESANRPARASVHAAGPSAAKALAQPAGEQRLEAIDGADLSGENFAGADFAGVCLREVRFDRANCMNAQFPFARLEGCTFSDACLDNANMSDVSLRLAELTGASCAGVDFSRSELCGADLTRCNLAGAVLQGANFRHANLSGVTWDEQTDFGNAQMQGARHISAELRARAEADGAIFGGAQP